MKLNLNSWHAKLYKATYVGLPNSLCPYFWKLLFAIILIPFTWLGLIIPIIREEKSIFFNFLLTFFLYAGVGGLVYIGLETVEINSNLDYFIAFLYGVAHLLFVTIVTMCILSLIALPIIGIRYIIKKAKENSIDQEPKQYIVTEWWKGIINKYCPRITWEQ